MRLSNTNLKMAPFNRILFVFLEKSIFVFKPKFCGNFNLRMATQNSKNINWLKFL